MVEVPSISRVYNSLTLYCGIVLRLELRIRFRGSFMVEVPLSRVCIFDFGQNFGDFGWTKI